ncbi:MAG: menaquinone biosynthetic enzyme MqnA/MqnD family protein [Planctomycetota bacterium]
MRYGSVSYLNARPLVDGLHPLVFATPAELVRLFERGKVDVALLPVAAGEAAGLTRVGRLGISARGRVDSVLLFLRCEVADVQTLACDPASRTSRVLAELYLREVCEVTPRSTAPPADAELVIGDAALVRGAGPEPRLDLAEEWHRWTGLPFVFAAWYGDPAAEEALEQAFARGQERIAAYAREAALGLAPERLEAYLRERVRYRLGDEEQAGLLLFVEKARRLGLL